MEKKDWFAEKAKDYDTDRKRTQNVSNIAQAMLKEIHFHPQMKVMDFGSGTGLLLTDIAPFVGEITAVDVSPAMNQKLRAKLDQLPCPVKIEEIDLTKTDLHETFDVIISSMTFHHVEAIGGLFQKLYGMLNPDGYLAVADIDKEDGSFHSSNTGVFHLGFDRPEFVNLASTAGFKDLKIQTVSTIQKPQGNYPVFLLTGKK